MTIKSILNLIIISSAFLTLSSCGDSTPTEKNGKIKVVCTTSMIGDMANQLATSDFDVITLMGPGVDPHLYKPTINDIKALKNSDIIILNGLHLEGAMQEAVDKLETAKTIITIADGLEKSDLRSTSEFDGNYDPHIWFDANVWSKCTSYTAKQLASAAANNKDSIMLLSKNYTAELNELNGFIQKELSQIPDSSRYLVTAHDAFGYLSKAYDIEVKALQGISTSSEFGLKDVMEIADFLISKRIKAVFVESSISSKSLEKVIETCAKKGLTVKIGGELHTDALGAVGTEEGTYIGMMKHNVETIVANLK